MKVIILEVDGRVGYDDDYQSLSAQGKLKFNEAVVELLHNLATEERMSKIEAELMFTNSLNT